MLSFSKSALCLLLASPLIAAVIATGCSSDPISGTTTGTTQSSGSGSSGGNGGNGASGGAGGVGGGSGGNAGTGAWSGMDGGFITANCQNQVYLCGDTIDNDGDGLTDWQDPDCLGPCDNSEDGLNLDIPGGDGPACTVDCYWDSNSGSGNDGCYWNHSCDMLSPEGSATCPYNANSNTPGTSLTCDELLNQQPATCLAVCPQLVPNGCDCFGCCVLYKGGKEYGPVWLGTEDAAGNDSCTLDKLGTLDQNAACAPCTQVKNDCYNGCGICELCIGKTVDDLPPECFPPPPPPDGGVPDSGPPPDGGTPDSGMDAAPPPPQCEGTLQPCGLPGQELCPGGFYCITGCCIEQPK
jgi:hypothetical protein